MQCLWIRGDWNRSRYVRNEKIPVAKHLPKGFVYRERHENPNWDVPLWYYYFIVTNPKLTSKMDDSHDYFHTAEKIIVEDKKMKYCESITGSSCVRRIDFFQVPNTEFQQFKLIYDAPENRAVRDTVRLSSSDLTNILD